MSINSRWFGIALSFALGLGIWLCPSPTGVELKAWHLFAIFVGTITLVVMDALPMGAGTLVGLTLAVCTKTLTFQQAFSGYANEVVWLILAAFFIAHGFIQTGLGRRIAYLFVELMGKKTLGLGYGISFAELMLAPAIPSVTARSGAIVYPIAKSLSEAFDSYPNDKSSRRLGAYLISVAFHSATIASAMFLTAMAANPLAAKLAKEAQIEITWGNWALFALVPGLLCLALMPLILFYLVPPEVKETPHAVHMAKEHLAKMGPLSKNEKLMLVAFAGLLFLWIFGSIWKIEAVTAALLGLAFLIFAGVLQWKDLLGLSAAWETFIWFGAFIAMAEGLNKLGLTAWFGEYAAAGLGDIHWAYALALLIVVYFYIHYFFASSTAHVGALYLPFLLVALNLGAPPLMTALLFGCASNLMGGLTHYGFGSAPILFGSGFVGLREWWRVGFLMSVFNLVIFIGSGIVWWYALGLLS